MCVCEICHESIDPINEDNVSSNIQTKYINISLDYHTDCFEVATGDIFRKDANLVEVDLSCHDCGKKIDIETSFNILHEISFWEKNELIAASVIYCDGCFRQKDKSFHLMAIMKLGG